MSSRLLLVASLLAAVFATTAFGQNYPLPGSSTSAPVLCNGCNGTNPYGVPNAGLPTWPYSSPIKAHVGRWVDSASYKDWQARGMRTARAGKVLIAPTTRGSAPPTAYMQVGAALAAYRLDTLFTTTLPAGTVPASAFQTGSNYTRDTPLERVIPPAMFVYPESKGSGWQIQSVDSQERLYDFDYDDRGYVYAAYMIIGWGIARDSGETNGAQMTKVAQVSADHVPLSPTVIISAKVNGHYYAIVSDIQTPSGAVIYNVDNPTTASEPPLALGYSNNSARGIRLWAKSPDGSKLAYVDAFYRLQIYDMATFIQGGAPLKTVVPGNNKIFAGVTADKDGNFWAAEKGNTLTHTLLYKYSAAQGYAEQTFDVYGQNFGPLNIRYGEGYLAIGGEEAGTATSLALDVMIFDVNSGTPKPLPMNDFVRNYYHTPPPGYAKPENYTSIFRGLAFYKQNNKLYFILGMHGMGDVYEIQGGDSISASALRAGTVNPKSKGVSTDTYYGDPISFKAISSNAAAFPFNVQWNFANPESGTDNAATSQTGNSVLHQYSGLTTAAAITAPKIVSAQVTSDSSIADSVTVNMKVPVARVVAGAAGTTVLTDNTVRPTIVLGDTFSDGSDGTIDGHYSEWTIDGVPAKKHPNEIVAAGDCGAHTLSFVAHYGPYNPADFTTTYTSSYTSQIANANYDVRPFAASINAPTSSGSNVTFGGTALVPPTGTITDATTWSVTWTLKSAATNGTVISTQTTTSNIGVIPTYTVPRNSINSGNVMVLTVELPAASLPTACANFTTATASMELDTPDPMIQKSGCDNANAPCTLTAKSTSNKSTAGWTYAWTLKKGTTVMATSTSNPWTPSIPSSGAYTASLTATKTIFTGNATDLPIAVAAPLCGELPNSRNMSLVILGQSSNCTGSNCTAGEVIKFTASPFGYTIQDCDTYTWTFGDGQTASGTGTAGTIVNHTYATGGTYNVKLVVSNTGGGTPVTFTSTVSFGSTPPPPPVCSIHPGTVTIQANGPSGCGTQANPCKIGDTFVFTLTRTVGGQSCDVYTWTFGDGTSSNAVAATKAYSAAGTYTVTGKITNTAGSTNTASYTVYVSNAVTCTALPPANRAEIQYNGASSGCTRATAQTCRVDENFTFTPFILNYTGQVCDKYEWNFDDGTSTTEKSPVHKFLGGRSTYHVTVKIYNDATPGGFTVATDMTLIGGQVIEPPVLSLNGPTSSGKNIALTFTATSDKPNTTAWKWTVNNPQGGTDRTDTSQQGNVSTTSTFTHTFVGTGTYDVVVEARNGNSVVAQKILKVNITNTPQWKFLLPVVIHGAGNGGSTWRTDLQVFNPDPNVSASPLTLQFEFNSNTRGKITKPLQITNSTDIREDFMNFLIGNGDDNGPVLVTASTNYMPQIWTRTYNVSSAGTFGQFIPAILLDGTAANEAAASTDEPVYHLTGLRNSSRYRANIGFVNPTSSPMDVEVRVYDDARLRLATKTITLQPFQLDQRPAAAFASNLPIDKEYSIEVHAPAGQWLITYASMIDGFSNDPTFIQGVRESDLAFEDYRHTVVPGVGHLSFWRSDVTIFNDDSETMQFDLTYYGQNGDKLAEAKNQVLGPYKFMQLNDLLRAGVLPTTPDSIGTLRIDTLTNHERYPVAFSRTYYDQGSAGSYGQGIPAFSAARANVRTNKPALLPAVRQDDNYYTNVGLVNVGSTTAKVRVVLLDEVTGVAGQSLEYTLAPNQSLIQPEFMKAVNSPSSRGTLRVEISNGTGEVWTYASVIDRHTKDPEYVAGLPTN